MKFDEIAQVVQEVATYDLTNKEQLEQFRNLYTGRKGRIADLFDGIKNIAPEQRKAYGQELNALKEQALAKFKARQEELESAGTNQTETNFDFTLPVIPQTLGTRHPLTLVREEIIRIFERMGFNLSEGPEIEDDWHNFSALNFPENHPARDMQDTFFVGEDATMLLRTHTSSVRHSR